MISRELIIIPPMGEKASNYYKVEVLNYHQDDLINYIILNHINIDIFDDAFIKTLAVEMASLDFVVVGTDGEEIYIFLPNTLTRAQAKWFDDYSQLISSSNVFVINIFGDDDHEFGIQYIENDDSGIKPVDRLYKEIKRKTIKLDEIKVKKYGNK